MNAFPSRTVLNNCNFLLFVLWSQRMYKVQVDFDLLLKAQYGEADCTAAVRAELRQIKNNLSRRETEASLTQY